MRTKWSGRLDRLEARIPEPGACGGGVLVVDDGETVEAAHERQFGGPCTCPPGTGHLLVPQRLTVQEWEAALRGDRVPDWWSAVAGRPAPAQPAGQRP